MRNAANREPRIRYNIPLTTESLHTPHTQRKHETAESGRLPTNTQQVSLYFAKKHRITFIKRRTTTPAKVCTPHIHDDMTMKPKTKTHMTPTHTLTHNFTHECHSHTLTYMFRR